MRIDVLLGLSGCLLIAACNQIDHRLMGEWRTESEFYNARYEIKMEQDSVRGEVLYYNDGTTIFESSDDDRRFVFRNLIEDGRQYVDAVSGATKTGARQVWSIEIRSDDTLLIGEKIGKQTRTEIWTRIKE